MSQKSNRFKLLVLIGIATVGLAFVLILAKKQDQDSQPQNQTKSENQQAKPSPDEEKIDTSDWKTYRNEEYGFGLKYPEDWVLNKIDKKLLIRYPKPRSNMPEGGRALFIEVRNVELEDFIKEYDESDTLTDGTPLSKITNTQGFILDEKSGSKLIGTTALGIDQNIIFVIYKNKSYIINYHDFDKYHLNILSTFKFL